MNDIAEGKTLATLARHNDPQTLLNAGAALAKPIQVADATLAYLLPDGHSVEFHNTDKWQAHPRRKQGIARPATVDAFTEYVERHLTDATTVWVHPSDGSVVAVIDDHEAHTIEDGDTEHFGDPGHGEHRAELRLAHTPEWLYWTGNDRSSLSQGDFAEHIEDGAKEVVEPAAALLLEIASTLQARKDSNVRQAIRLDNGETKYLYDETIEASAGKGNDLTIPAEFKLAVAPFVGEPLYAVTARLRYRLNGGKVTFSYHLDRPHDIVRDALESVRGRLAEAFPAVYVGVPRS